MIYTYIYLLPDAAEVDGQAVLVVLHPGAGDGLHLGRQRAEHLHGNMSEGEWRRMEACESNDLMKTDDDGYIIYIDACMEFIS